MSSNSFAIVRFATAMFKMKTLPTGFPVALCSTAIQFSDRRSNRSFLLLRIADFVVDVVDVLDVWVSETVAFPPRFLRHCIFELSESSDESSAESSDDLLFNSVHKSAKAP